MRGAAPKAIQELVGHSTLSSELQNPRSCDDPITELRQALERRGGLFDERLTVVALFGRRLIA
jgi:hypothetical protein